MIVGLFRRACQRCGRPHGLNYFLGERRDFRRRYFNRRLSANRNGSRRGCAGTTFLQLHKLVFDGRHDLVVLLGVLEEIRNVKKGIPLESDVHKCRLHARQDLRDFAFIDVADNPLGAMSFDVILDKFVVLQDGEFRLLWCSGNNQFFLHGGSCGHCCGRTGSRRDTSPSHKGHALSWGTPVPGGAGLPLFGTGTAQLCAAALRGNLVIFDAINGGRPRPLR